MSQATELTDDHLLRRMMDGDEEAFTQMYRRRQPPLYRFALHMSGNTAIAEDVTQEVFMTLIRDLKRFDPARGTLGGFLFGIARNHLRKRWAQEQRLVPLPKAAGEIYPQHSLGSQGGNGTGRSDDEYGAVERAARLRQAIATLPENYREALVLCELQEMSYEAAAAALDCPIGTVRSRLHRARALLIEKLREAEAVRRVSA